MSRCFTVLALFSLSFGLSSPCAFAQESQADDTTADPQAAEDPWDPVERAATRTARFVGHMMDPVVDLFGTELPNTLENYRMEISLDPSFRDFLDEDNVRMPVELRYRLNSRTDLTAEVEPFIPNFINHGAGWGVSYYRLGGKMQLPHLLPGTDTAVGLKFQYPLSFPPDDPSDGHMRTEPYITFERELPWVKGLHGFVNFGYQFVEYKDGYRAPDSYLEPDDKIFDQDNARITFGVIQYRGLWNPFIRAEYRRETESGPHLDKWFVEQGVMFDFPRDYKYTHKLPGKWRAELALRVEVEDEKPEVSLDLSVKWKVRLHELGIVTGED